MSVLRKSPADPNGRFAGIEKGFLDTFEMMDEYEIPPGKNITFQKELKLIETIVIERETGMVPTKSPNENPCVNGIPLSEIMSDKGMSNFQSKLKQITPITSLISVNRVITKSCAKLSHPIKENGYTYLVKKVSDWKIKLRHDSIRKNEACIARGAESGSHISKGNVAPSEWRSKPKGKMRQSEYRKAAQQLELYLANVA